MLRTIPSALLCWLFLLAQSHGQDVFVPRELKAPAVTRPEMERASQNEKTPPADESVVVKQSPVTQPPKTAPANEPSMNLHPEKVESAQAGLVKAPAVKEPASKPRPEKMQAIKFEPVRALAGKESVANAHPEKIQPVRVEPVKAPVVKEPAESPRPEKIQAVKTEPVKAPALKEPAENPPSEKIQTAKTETAKAPVLKEPATNSRPQSTQSVKAEPVKAPAVKEPANSHPEKIATAEGEPVKAPAAKEPAESTEPGSKPRSEKTQVKIEPDDLPGAKELPTNPHSNKTQPVKTEPDTVATTHSKKIRSEPAESVKAAAAKGPAVSAHPEKVQAAKVEPAKAPAMKEIAANSRAEKVQPVKTEPVKASTVKESTAANPQPEKIHSEKTDPVKMLPAQEPTMDLQLSSRSMETVSTRLADGFDFPVGKPEAEGYYKARGFHCGGHMGEDWDGIRGGNTDLNDPIYCIGDGVVVFARDVHRGWGNVVIVRHAYRESGTVKHIDSLYGHLNLILVRRGQKVARGQRIGTMGTAHGQYEAHLHLEIRKNLEIGMSRAKFQKNLSNYYDPSQFIESHRHLSGGGANFRVAMNTFTHDSAYHFDDSPNISARKHSTAQSAAALKQAISDTH